jgi:hypothetical protein
MREEPDPMTATHDHLWPDPVLAVDRAMRPHARQFILDRLRGTPMEGATVADYIDEAINRDAYLEHTEPWFERANDSAQVLLADEYPDVALPYLSRLVTAALMAEVVHHGHAPRGIREVVELAGRAACWAEGYAYSRPVAAILMHGNS